MDRIFSWLLCAVVVTGLSGTPSGFAAAANRLAGSPSPYLALHGDDPVHWQPWGEAVLEQAQRERKLIFVSIGYFACHWCHVMQRESFQNPEVAEKLNASFVSVKVDRELEPVLDAQLMEFLHATRGYGGWPLNVFLTPEGYPVTGTVYLPPDEFLEFLNRLDQRWKEQGPMLGIMAGRAAMKLAANQQELQTAVEGVDANELVEHFYREIDRLADELSGGFGDQAKFPSVPQLMALLEIAAARKDERYKTFLTLTLERMADYGLRDQLGGGFFRYTVDPAWQVPHFEKMLYDNALLALLYLRAGDVLNRADFIDVGFDTLRFMREGMVGRDGALVASLSAVDDRDVEGGYYLWSKDELESLLTPEQWAVAEPAWGLDRPPILEHGHLPIRARSAAAVAQMRDLPEPEVAARLERARDKTLKRRATRGLPVDDKRLAGWNGLALSAFSEGARRGDQGSAAAAKRIRDFVASKLWVNGELFKAVDAKGRGLGPGNLEDYAYVVDGLSRWAAHTGARADIDLAQAIAEAAWQSFHSEEGWRLETTSLLPLPVVRLTVHDSPLPSPSAVLIEASARLAGLSNDAALAELAERASRVVSESMRSEPYANATQIALFVRAGEPPPKAAEK